MIDRYNSATKNCYEIDMFVSQEKLQNNMKSYFKETYHEKIIFNHKFNLGYNKRKW